MEDALLRREIVALATLPQGGFVQIPIALPESPATWRVVGAQELR